MSIHLDAVYEKGVFRPLQPVALTENQLVKVTVEAVPQGADMVHFVLPPERWQAFCDALDAPPREIPALRKLLGETGATDG
jgi:uncharacterized protein (DUF1778 family)